MGDATAQTVYFYDRHPISLDIILIKFGNDGSAADQFAHTNIASVTASAASVTAAEVAIIGIMSVTPALSNYLAPEGGRTCRRPCPLRVKSRHVHRKTPCPLYPQ
jgi:hypothetical protein